MDVDLRSSPDGRGREPRGGGGTCFGREENGATQRRAAGRQIDGDGGEGGKVVVRLLPGRRVAEDKVSLKQSGGEVSTGASEGDVPEAKGPILSSGRDVRRGQPVAVNDCSRVAVVACQDVGVAEREQSGPGFGRDRLSVK
jgi:hypothetical protein